MDGGSPSRHKEKRSKKNQDRAAIPKLFGHTKAAYQRGGAGGSHAACCCVNQGSSATAPPPAPTSIEDVPIVDEEEEALEHVGRTIATPPVRTPTTRLGFISQLVPFLGVSPIMREPTMVSNPASGWTPPLLVDYRH